MPEPVRLTARVPRSAWVFSTYFAEGLPYSLVRQVSTVFFRDAGTSLEGVGLTSLYSLPWVFKFLWAPLVDAFGTRRRWLLAAEGALAIGLVLLAGASALPGPILPVAIAFLVVAFLSATHDIAVDGFYLEAQDRTAQARNVGFQAMAYRFALIAGGGGLVWLSARIGWPAAFGCAAIVCLALLGFHARVLPDPSAARRPFADLAKMAVRPRVVGVVGLVAAALLAGLYALDWRVPERVAGLSIPAWSALFLLGAVLGLLGGLGALQRRLARSSAPYARAFLDWLDQPRIGVILVFVVLYRLGESALLAMGYPALADCGLTRAQYGLTYGTCGVASGIAGGLVGGWLIGRYGLRRTIWPLVLSQNVPNLLYALLTWRLAGAAGETGLEASMLAWVTGLVAVEAFGAGLGTAVFMVFVMRTTRPAYRSAHMAIATGVMNVASALAGVGSGFLAARIGFPAFFGCTFLAAVPGMVCIPFLPLLDDPPSPTSPPAPPGRG
ncbi:MAG: MFS transporter [Deltaproteobacteria bacterium]|nr:MFS transporter [Deltaproteobacteria bacterium]